MSSDADVPPTRSSPPDTPRTDPDSLDPDVRAALFPDLPGLGLQEFLELVSGSQHGTTPSDGPWQWLLIVSPHSATPFDLAQTMGSAAFVLGCFVFGVVAGILNVYRTAGRILK